MSDAPTTAELLKRIEILEALLANSAIERENKVAAAAPDAPEGTLAHYIKSKNQAGDGRLVREEDFPTKLPDTDWVSEMIRRKTNIINRVYASYSTHNTDISVSDDMWVGLHKDGNGWDRMHYFYGGRSALRAASSALISAGSDIPNRILDFPCGFCRVLRFFRAAFPQATIYGGDLNWPGVDYCAEKFGSLPIYSQTELDAVELPNNIDLVWSGSLATHLPEEACIKLFNRLIDCLAPNGIAGITVCGRGMIYNQENVTEAIESDSFNKIKQSLADTGFAYENYAGLTDYGMTYIDMRWIQKVVYSRGDCYLLSYAEKDWHGGQDTVWVIKRPISHSYNWGHDD